MNTRVLLGVSDNMITIHVFFITPDVSICVLNLPLNMVTPQSKSYQCIIIASHHVLRILSVITSLPIVTYWEPVASFAVSDTMK